MIHILLFAPLAQLDRAFDCGSKGQKFESSRAHHYFCFQGLFMKILFAPSEQKSKVVGTAKFDFNKLLFPQLKEKRELALKKYSDFIDSSTNEELSKFFGLKDEDSVKYYKESFKEKTGIKAILRYEGVAYKALDYKALTASSKEYVDKNVIIFSNLYGPLLADTILPDYKFKQGAKIENFKIENFYEEHFSHSLDEYLQDEDILDIRAGFYDKFYTIKKEYTTLKFLKDGKVVSHFAKHYRGIVLKQIAKFQIKNLAEFDKIKFENLTLLEIKKIKNKREILLKIVEK